MRRRRAIATALILCCTAAVAQEDTLLERFYHRASVDTSYVVRPTTRWTLKGRFLLSHNNLTTNGLHNGATIATGINGGYSPKASLSASYLGLTVNASVNPRQTAGPRERLRAGAALLRPQGGRRVLCPGEPTARGVVQAWRRRGGAFGIERIVEGAHGDECLLYLQRTAVLLPRGLHPAYIQRRSCGSLLAGATIEGLYLTLGDSTIG